MQNLKNIDHRVVSFANDGVAVTATAWDLNDDSLIYATGPTKHDPLLSLKRLHKTAYRAEDAESVAAWDALSPSPDLSHDRIVDLHCFSDTQTIVLVLEGGDLVVVREDPQAGEEAVEIVGSVDAGIAAAAWSPDEELLSLVTKAETVLLMTRSFEGTAEVSVSNDDLKVSNHVSVGWGKAETQFRGRGAKALRDPTIPEHIDAGTLSSEDDGRVCISWRGDGQYVAINSVLQQPSRRVIRVLTREGVLESVSEAVDGLEAAVSWKPSGQIIAGVQRAADKVDVVFFEKNGLRHGEFGLRLEDHELRLPVDLKWNIDSTALAVTVGHRVQLWTSSNYYWYLKQEIILPSLLGSATLAWHSEKPLKLSCGNGSQIHTLGYTFQYEIGSTSSPHDIGIVAAVDGRKLHITPLAIANIPPPMAFDEVTLQKPITDVAINTAGNLLAVLHADKVVILQCAYASKPVVKATLLSSHELDQHGHVRQICFVDDALAIIRVVENEEFPQCSLLKDGEFETKPPIEQIVTIADQWTYSPTGMLTSLSSEQMLPTALPSNCAIAKVWQENSSQIAFGLTATGVLHIVSNSQQLKISGCTSFVVADSYLVLTTSQHLLKFVHLHDGQLEIPADEPEKDERCRSIERGAKLVTVMPSSYALVLQMPRGNLETIYPRALVLASIRRHLTNRDYKKAFLVCRSQRVDMNILYDYLPAQFLEDVELFIKQVHKKEYVDLFISSLTEEDTSQTIYKETLQTARIASAVTHVSKVNAICDAFLTTLEPKMPTTLQNVITAHVCKSPPDLGSALRLVAALRERGNEEELEHAVEHVCFLADVYQLYDAALGLYELEVALLVAQQSQKDPREYLPYLQGLQKMETKRQHFTIDNDLKKYAKALTHLHDLDAFDELTSYMKRHNLYSTAIELYRHDKQRLVGLIRAYADYQTSRNQYGDAGILYEYVQDYTAANEAYRAAGMWRESLSTAALIPLSTSEIETLAEGIAEAQEESKDFTSAAIVRLDYLNDLPGAVRLYCKAYNFAEATRLAIFKQQSELMASVIDPGLIECSASMTELLAEMKGQINAQVPRLRELRQKKIDEPMAYLNAGEGEDNDIPDNLSVAPTDASTSGGTFMTRYTNRSTGTVGTNATRKTSKNRRREERKRAKGKKGTVYEEEYLVNSITRLIERLNTTSEDITRLVQGLMRRAMRERAIAVENAMVEVRELCQQHMDEVYEISKPVVPAEEQLNGDGVPYERPLGGQGVLWDSLNAVQVKVSAPTLKVYARSGALTSA